MRADTPQTVMFKTMAVEGISCLTRGGRMANLEVTFPCLDLKTTARYKCFNFPKYHKYTVAHFSSRWRSKHLLHNGATDSLWTRVINCSLPGPIGVTDKLLVVFTFATDEVYLKTSSIMTPLPRAYQSQKSLYRISLCRQNKPSRSFW